MHNSFVCNSELETAEHFLLDSLMACTNAPNQFKMYFIFNLAFVNYFDSWTNSIMPSNDLNITEEK